MRFNFMDLSDAKNDHHHHIVVKALLFSCVHGRIRASISWPLVE